MGNCFRRESRVQSAGDNWGEREEEFSIENKGEDDVVFKTDGKFEIGDLPSSPATAVKIKITKKQLEDLLGKVDLKEISPEQVLDQLMKIGDDFRNETQQRPWRPALQSIPE